jgi:hypothetical protein
VQTGSTSFRVLLCIGWAVLLIVTLQAVSSLGLDAAGQTFFDDLSHPWRAQFNADFGLHLLLVAAWMVWRSKSLLVGLLCGLLAILMGGLFTLAYLLVASIRVQGDFRKVLLGHRSMVGA